MLTGSLEAMRVEKLSEAVLDGLVQALSPMGSSSRSISPVRGQPGAGAVVAFEGRQHPE